MSMTEPTLSTAGFAGEQQQQQNGGLAGLPYQHYNVGVEAHPGELFTQGRQMAPNPNSLFSEADHPLARALSPRQFSGGGRPAMEQQGEEEG